MLDDLLTVAREAGSRILEHYGVAQVSLKADQSPLTTADLAAHRHIVASLRDLTPGIPVISEESSPGELLAHSGTGDHWMVDPLDGTKEFLKQTGEFTVNIALIRDKRPVIGVVHAPAIDRSYWAKAGEGAFRRLGTNGEVERIRTRAANLSELTIVASRDHAGPGVDALLRRFPHAATCSMGSSLKFCLVAEGCADVYLRDLPTSEWDTAAAQCVLEAAGGTVVNLDGSPFLYGKASLRNPGFISFGDPSSSKAFIA
ncbi:MAG: 3'(2'),5'-bisphosphate nucleotidase CysQ [Verrucomicrobia bacterium]|nr:3'(2'),5'-bisphosphate nucleotidase CysQ [Verrucomicrobiota bacterium]